jgi:hypothetical protein
MTLRNENELSSIEHRLNDIPMYGSERVVAVAASRSGFIIVEQFAWLAQKIIQLGALLFSRPVLTTEQMRD